MFSSPLILALSTDQKKYLSDLSTGEIEFSNIPNNLIDDTFCFVALQVLPYSILKTFVTETEDICLKQIEQNPDIFAKRLKILFCLSKKSLNYLVLHIPNFLIPLSEQGFGDEFPADIWSAVVSQQPNLLTIIPEKFLTDKLICDLIDKFGNQDAHFILSSVLSRSTSSSSASSQFLFTEDFCWFLVETGRVNAKAFELFPSNFFEKKVLSLPNESLRLLVMRYPVLVSLLSEKGLAAQLTPDIWFAAISQQPDLLKIIPKNFLTNKLLGDLIDEFGKDDTHHILGFVPELRTEDLCLFLAETGRLNKQAFKLFPYNSFKKIDQIYLEMIDKNELELKEIPEEKRSDPICKIAIKRDIFALKYVPNKTWEICSAAVKRCGLALEFVPDKFKEQLFETAIKQNGGALAFIPDDKMTQQLCEMAVEEDKTFLNVIALVPQRFRTDDLLLKAFKRNGLFLKDIPESERTFTESIYKAAIAQHHDAYKYVPIGHLTIDLLKTAVSGSGLLLKKFIKNSDIAKILFSKREETKAICLAAVQQNPIALAWVPDDLKADIIDKLTVEYILTKKFNAIKYFPKEKDYTPEIEALLSRIEFITVRKNESSAYPYELEDIELVYCNRPKHRGKTVSIADSDTSKDDLQQLLIHMEKANIKHPLSIALIGHSNESSEKLGGISYVDMVQFCKEHPAINDIKLLGCKVAQARPPETEKKMSEEYLHKYLQKLDKAKKLKVISIKS